MLISRPGVYCSSYCLFHTTFYVLHYLSAFFDLQSHSSILLHTTIHSSHSHVRGSLFVPFSEKEGRNLRVTDSRGASEGSGPVNFKSCSIWRVFCPIWCQFDDLVGIQSLGIRFMGYDSWDTIQEKKSVERQQMYACLFVVDLLCDISLGER